MTNCSFCAVVQQIFLSQRINVFDDKDESKLKVSDTFLLGRILGSGKFSVVRQGQDREGSFSYAIKKINKSKLTEKDLMSLQDEINIQMSLSHPHIIKLYAAIDENHFYYLFTEMAYGGELLDQFSSKATYSIKEAKIVIRTLLDAIEYCHSRKITHRDIKPGNIFLTHKLNYSNVKIGDWGFAKYTPSPYSLQTQCGTAAFAAPEILIGNRYGTEVDMWSLGVVFYQLILGDHPFYNPDDSIMIQNIKIGNCRHQIEYCNSSYISNETKVFLSSLLQVNPQKRLSAKEALEHSWIRHHNSSQSSTLELLQKLRASVLLVQFANKISTTIHPEEFNAKKMFKATVNVMSASSILKRNIKTDK